MATAAQQGRRRRARGQGRSPGAGTPPAPVHNAILRWCSESLTVERVDREAGVIRGVRVCGTVSENGRRYTPEALQSAIPLYEGISVRINHPKKPSDQRETEDVFGWLEDVRPGPDGGLYADLHFLKAHPLAESVCEAAERNPSLYGLSHNAQGDGHYEGPVLIVEEITEVRSVDLVADPATNKSLFESKEATMAKTTLRKLIKESKVETKLKKRLLEWGDMAPSGDGQASLLDDDMDMPPAEDEGDWKQDLVSAIGKLVGSEAPEDHDMAKKIMAMLKPAEAVNTEEEEEEGDEDDREVPEGDDDPPKDKNGADAREGKRGKTDPAVKELQEEVRILREERGVLRLIEQAGLAFSKPEAKDLFVKALIPLAVGERKTLIEERKAVQPRGGAPRSNAPGAHTNRLAGLDAKGFGRFVKNGE